MGFRALRFFFEADRTAVAIELDHTITLWIAHLISENACAAFDREGVAEEIEFSVKDVVAQNQARAGVANEFRADHECFRDAVRFRLLSIFDLDSKLRAIAQKITQHRQIFGCRNDQDLAQSAEHEGRERVTNHRFVVNREQLLADDLGNRKEPVARAAPKNDGLLCHELTLYVSNFETAGFCRGLFQNPGLANPPWSV